MRRLPVIALLLVAVACGGDEGAPRAGKGLAAPGCVGPHEVWTNGSRDHLPDGARGEYETDPPAFGRHYGKPTFTGIHDDPVPDEFQVHNLEHGHVVIQYRDLQPDELQALREQVLLDPLMVLLAPRPSMKARVAFTSWGMIQLCNEVPANLADVARAFVEANRDNAPESIPGTLRAG